jgi:peptidoglycan/xylan/chitin deacetylase (PgdA/CDA1 family)/glycosyltransferase involved in cell wall biosynthesis
MLRLLLQRVYAGKLAIFTFHGVPDGVDPLWPQDATLAQLDNILDVVQQTHEVLPLQDGLLRLRAGRLTQPAVALTFDDGYATWRGRLPEMLERRNAHATFFVTTDPILNSSRLWSDRLRTALAAGLGNEGLRLSLPGMAMLDMRTEADRLKVLATLDRHLKYCSQTEREEMLVEIERQLGVKKIDVPGAFSDEDVRRLHSRGFSIGAHSRSHTVLTCCSDEQAWHECADSKAQLESLIGAPVSGFAFPNGLPYRDFQPKHIDMLRRLGYRYAVTTASGVAGEGTDALALPRFTPWATNRTRIRLQMLRSALAPDASLARVSAREKRALLVAFHFPPQTGSSGMLRTLNFAKYLPEHGWQATVLTSKPSAYPKTNDDLIPDVPPRTRLIRAGALDAGRHLAINGRYLSWTALPDRWSSWLLSGVVLGLLRSGLTTKSPSAPQVIWSTYPLPTAHLIGAGIARISGLPWVADFRDPMNASGDVQTKSKRWLWGWIERYVVKHADRCVFTTEAAAQGFIERYPAFSHKVRVISNGYDEEAFSTLKAKRFDVSPDAVMVLHSGLIYPEERDPTIFFHAVQRLLASGELPRERLRVRFRASGVDDRLLEIAQAAGLADVFEVAPPLPYRDAVAEMMAADLLLLVQGRKFNAQIPAKAYEYLRSSRPVLGLVGRGGQSANLLSQFEATYQAENDDLCGVEGALRAWWADSKDESTMRKGLEDNVVAIRAYSRSAQTERLSGILDELI